MPDEGKMSRWCVATLIRTVFSKSHAWLYRFYTDIKITIYRQQNVLQDVVHASMQHTYVHKDTHSVHLHESLPSFSAFILFLFFESFLYP